jgi:hypothetical protein
MDGFEATGGGRRAGGTMSMKRDGSGRGSRPQGAAAPSAPSGRRGSARRIAIPLAIALSVALTGVAPAKESRDPGGAGPTATSSTGMDRALVGGVSLGPTSDAHAAGPLAAAPAAGLAGTAAAAPAAGPAIAPAPGAAPVAGAPRPARTPAADATRFELELAVEVDTRNQSLEASALRTLQQRIRATGHLGTRILWMMIHPEPPSGHRIVVRGTTVPRLVERLLPVASVCGWARAVSIPPASPDAQPGWPPADREPGSIAGSRPGTPAPAARRGRARRGAKPVIEEHGPFLVDPWGGGAMQWMYLEAGSEERAASSCHLHPPPPPGFANGDAEEQVCTTVEPPGDEHRDLVLAGMLVPARTLAGSRRALLPVPQSSEEQAALLGLVLLSPQSLPCPVRITSSRITPMAGGSHPPTLTRRLAGAGDIADASPLVRARAVRSAIARKDAAARALLRRALADPDPGVCLLALQGLRARRAAPATADLERLARSPCPELASEAVATLVRGGAADGRVAAMRLLTRDHVLASALAAVRTTRFTEAVPLLERLVVRAQAPEAVRLEALDVFLALAGPGRARPLLARLARDASPAVRHQASLRAGAAAPAAR